jgi:hypothetical protein
MASDNGVSRTGGRLLLAADAFLFAGAFNLLVISLFLGVPTLLGADIEAFVSSLGQLWGSLLSLLSLVASGLLVLVGATVAWRMHGRDVDAGVIGVMIVGSIAGIAASMAAFVGGTVVLARVARLLTGPNESGGPWVVLGALALLVIALVAPAIVDGIRDLAKSGRQHVRLDWARLVAVTAIVLLGVVFLPIVTATTGSEIGEAGAFMVPFAAGAAFGVLGAEMLRTSRERHHGTAGGTLTAS